ncbi:MAG: hypothetical protein K6347_04430, partial [Campylobacterales bacterium]
VKSTNHRAFCLAIDPTTNAEKSLNRHNCAGRWQLLASNKSLPFLTQTPNEGLRFPVAIPEATPFFVGPLDVTGNPIVEDSSTREARYYFEAKKYVEKKEWNKALNVINKAIAKAPNSLFSSELLFLKIQSLFHLIKNGDTSYGQTLLETSLQWMKTYPTDENFPEVLLMTADTYAALGDKKEAHYYYDRIRTDYPSTKYAPLSKIHEGDFMLQINAPARAMTLYSEALAETKDLDVASLAAISLANRHVAQKEKQEATSLYLKVWRANPAFFDTKPQQTYEIALFLADQNQTRIALDMITRILPKIAKEDSLYEDLLYKQALLMAALDNKSEAKKVFETYLKTYPMGKYAKEAKEQMARLFLILDEKDSKKRREGLDKIIEEYAGSELAQRALLEKGELLAKEGAWKEILELKPKLLKLPQALAPRRDALLKEAANAEALRQFNRGNCPEAIKIVSNHGAKLPSSLDEKLFNCYAQMGKFNEAHKIARRHLNDEPAQQKLYWMANLARVLFAAQRHKEAINLTKDLINLTAAYQDEIPKAQAQQNFELLYDLFTSAQAINDEELMIKTASLAEQVFRNRVQNIPLYKGIVRLGQRRKDATMTEIWIKKIVDLQFKKKVRIESPWAEFTYADLLARKGRYADAAGLMRSLADLSLKPDERSRSLYLLATYEAEAGNLRAAKEALTSCLKLKGKSSWDRLCQEAIKLY